MKLLFAYKNSHVALGIKVATILFANLVIYHQDLTILGNEAIRSELMNYMLAIPFLLTYLLYRKRKMLRAVASFETSTTKRKTTFPNEVFIGALLCLNAFLLYWHGSYTFNPLEYHMASLPVFTAGLTLIMFNTKTLKVLAFPITFLLFLTPPPLEVVYATGATLSTISSEAAYSFLKAVGLPVSLENQYGNPVIILQKPEAFPLIFAIDIACSGMYSLIGFTIFAVFAAYIARGAPWKKTTVFLAGIPLIYSLNITRIIVTVLMGNQYGMEIAIQAFHLLGGGVLILTGTIILLTLSEKIFKIQLYATKPKITPCNHCNQNAENKKHFCTVCGNFLNPMKIELSKRDLTKIFILTISAILIINLQAPVFALTEGPAEVITQSPSREQATTQILPDIPGYTLQFTYRDKEFEQTAKQDASLTYTYAPIDRSQPTIWIILEIAKSRSSLHPWEVCLITYPQTHGYQPQAIQFDLRDVQLIQNPPVIGRFFAFKQSQTKSNITQVVLYWYENAVFNTGRGYEQKYAKISLMTFAEKSEDIPIIENKLLPIGKAIANHWQPIKTWSQIALIIAQHGATLTIITIFLLAMTLVYQFVKNRERRRSKLRFFQKLALREDQLVLRAAHEAARKGRSTGNTIASHYQKLAEKSIELELLSKKLHEAEEAGLIKRDITSTEDEPTLVWKSQMPSKI